MKRTATPALLLLFALFWLPTKPSTAQEAEQKKLLDWEKVREGVQVLRLWESVGPKWPEIAILRLSKPEYEKFVKDPVNYLNDRKIYPAKYPAKKVVRCRVVPPTSPKSEYIVVLNHDPDSTSTTIPSGDVVF